MLEINATAQFRRDRRLCIKRGYDMTLLNAVVDTLCVPAPLPPENRDHVLVGQYVGAAGMPYSARLAVDLPCGRERALS